MKLYYHKDYNEYLDSQIDKNIKKLNHVWVKEIEIKNICGLIKEFVKNPTFGICHGVRNGWEVKRLKDILEIDVIGTEISPTATDFDDIIQWDFHDVKDEWINNVDFIYSNSFDHSYKPVECLDAWMKCVNEKGICMIHWMKTNEDTIDAADCFAGTMEEYRDIFTKKYEILKEVDRKGRCIFVIGHKK